MSARADSEQSIRDYYDQSPYPNLPIEATIDDADTLYSLNFLTAYYIRNRQLPPDRPLRILDAGCGGGISTLSLARANPGARITGIDLSQRSIEVAAQRMAYHHIQDTQFHALKLEDLPRLGEKFDYINCDEVLYILPDPVGGLKALASVLAPGGILRTNLHDRYQREPLFRAQKAFSLMNAVGGIEGASQVQFVREMMGALADRVSLKQICWKPEYREQSDEWINMNYLLQGDKGFTVPETFRMLDEAGLEFISMLLWPQWDVLALFEDHEPPPEFSRIYPQMPLEMKLYLCELLHGQQRLIDFWCGHPGDGLVPRPLPTWEEEEFANARIRLHPQMATPQLKAHLEESFEKDVEFHLNRYLKMPGGAAFTLNSRIARGLLPLWDGPQKLGEFAQGWAAQVVEAARADGVEIAFEAMQQDLVMFLVRCEMYAYILAEPGP